METAATRSTAGEQLMLLPIGRPTRVVAGGPAAPPPLVFTTRRNEHGAWVVYFGDVYVTCPGGDRVEANRVVTALSGDAVAGSIAIRLHRFADGRPFKVSAGVFRATIEQKHGPYMSEYAAASLQLWTIAKAIEESK